MTRTFNSWRVFVVMLIACGVVTLGRSAARAERPSAPKLLPDTTLAYIRVADSRDLVKRFNETAFGRMFQDEKIKPLIQQLYGSASQAFVKLQEQIGVSLSELLAIPQGEVCVALVGREEGKPAFVVLLDAGDHAPVTRKLLERAVELRVQQGTTKRTEQVGNITLHILEGKATYCERDNTFLVSSDTSLLKAILKVWDGDGEFKTLADSHEFTSIMTRSVGAKDERPQVTWYADPIEFITHMARGNFGAQATLAMFPALGLDGIEAIGGSMIFATENYDSVSFIHLMLDNPRDGVLEMLAIESGDLTPEDWVPQDAASYMSAYWDSQKTIAAFRKLYNTIRGQGALEADIRRRLSDRLQLDFEKEILAQVDGRFTHVTWMEKPVKLNSGTTLVGIKLMDAAAFRKTLDQLASRFTERLTKKQFGKSTYYSIIPQRRAPNVDEDLVRRPTPCAAVVGDYLLLSDSNRCLEHALANKADPDKSLANELDFKLIASRIKQLSGSSKPGMIAFSRPEETMRSFYEMATSPSTRRKLSDGAQNNAALRALHQALSDNPLPPFSVIAKYLAPGGGMLYSDQSGIHYMTFGLKRE